jgi:hypothetical protein
MAPSSVVQNFLEDAIKEIKSLRLDRPSSTIEIRSILLEQQSSVLESVLVDYNDKYTSHVTTAEVQEALKTIKDPSLSDLAQELNEVARLTYARLVLMSGCLQESQQTLKEKMSLKASGSIERKALMDLFALCQTAVRLPMVQEHLVKGGALFEGVVQAPVPIIPQKRLERVQCMFLVALGYDPDFGTEEIKRIFLSQDTNEFAGDTELTDTFSSTVSTMHVAITNANIEASKTNFSDLDKGGTTRVVAVEYSEKVLDSSGKVVDPTPSGQSMEEHTEEQQRQQLHVASQAAAMQQEILGELLAMSESDRKKCLSDAERASKDFMIRVMAKPPGPERIEILQSIDAPTQRLMVMHKLWEANNRGKSPR